MQTKLLDVDLNAFLARQVRWTCTEFNLSFFSAFSEVRLEWGEQPEFRPADGILPPTIVLSRHEPDWWRVRYQVAHEVFHCVCTPPRTFHWSHELFAVESAVRA